MSDITVTVTNPVTKVVSVSAGNSANVDALATRLVQTGAYLESQIKVSAAGVTSIGGQSGAIGITGAGNITVTQSGQLFTFSGAGATGNYYLNSNPSGYITGIDTSNFALKSQTGNFVTTNQTGICSGSFYPLIGNPSGFLTGSTGGFVSVNQTGVYSGSFYPLNSNPSNYVASSQTGVFATTGYVAGVSGVLSAQTTATGSYLYGLIQASSAGVGSINGQSGSLIVTGAGNVVSSLNGQTFTFSGNTGSYANFALKTDTGSFVVTGQTGIYSNSFYPLNSNPSSYVTSGQTGLFITTGQTGIYANSFYPLNSNPSNYITPSQTGSFATTGYVTGASGFLSAKIDSTGTYLYGLIQASSAGVSSINGQSGSLTLTGAGNVISSLVGQTITFSGDTGAYSQFYLRTNPSGYITGSTGGFLSASQTGILVGKNETGIYSGSFYPLNSNPSAYLTGSTGGFLSASQTGILVGKNETGTFITTGQTGIYANSFYPLNSNPSNYLTGSTGGFVSTAQTGIYSGSFYPLNSNPSSYVTPSQTGGFLTSSTVGGVRALNITGLQSSGDIAFTGAGNIFLTQNGQTVTFSGATGSLVGRNETGILVGINQTGAYANTFVQLAQTGIYSGSFATLANTGLLLVGKDQTGIYANSFYPLNSNPSSYVTSGQTGILVGKNETGSFQTGFFKSMYLESPAVGDRISLFKTTNQLLIKKVTSVVTTTGAAPSVDYKITQASSFSAASGTVLGTNTESNQTTGTLYTSFINSIITGGNYVFFECSASSNTYNIHVTLEF